MANDLPQWADPNCRSCGGSGYTSLGGCYVCQKRAAEANNMAEAPDREPVNYAGEPFFEDCVLLVACPQCIEARLWPLNCGHQYVEWFKQEYRRVTPLTADDEQRAREIAAGIVNAWRVEHEILGVSLHKGNRAWPDLVDKISSSLTQPRADAIEEAVKRLRESAPTPLLAKIVEICDAGSTQEFSDADERLRAIRGLIIGRGGLNGLGR